MKKPRYATGDKVRRIPYETALEVIQIIWKDEQEKWVYRLSKVKSPNNTEYASEIDLCRWYVSANIEVAEALHDKLCHWDHTEGCGWHYGDWERKPLDHSRKTYLAKAKSVLEVTDKQTILAILERI